METAKGSTSRWGFILFSNELVGRKEQTAVGNAEQALATIQLQAAKQTFTT